MQEWHAELKNDYIWVDDHYGGKQLWWGKGSIGNHFGCGVIAAYDSLMYQLGQRTMEKWGYMSGVNELWKSMRPNTGLRRLDPYQIREGQRGFGVPWPWAMKRGVARFMRHKPYKITYDVLDNGGWLPWTQGREKDAVGFIKECLNNDLPVHLLSWKHTARGLDFHWITITAMTASEEGINLTYATWGRKYELMDFEAFWQRKRLLDRKWLFTFELYVNR